MASLISPDLLALFDSLQLPPVGTGADAVFTAYPVPGLDRYRVAKDAAGNPSLLVVSAQPAVREGPAAPIVLEHLSAQHRAMCRITRPDGSVEQGYFTVITCTSSEIGLRNHFLQVASAIIDALGRSPSQSDITKALYDFVELFRALTRGPREQVQGIWAELFLIARARRPEFMARAWHVSAEDRYDFSAGPERIEVKSTGRRIRQHHFSLEQLRSPAQTRVLIASMFVERSGAGTSLGELMQQVRLRLSATPDLAVRVEGVVAEALGSALLGSLDDRFDKELADESVAFYEAREVPQPREGLPPGVSEVHFISDLSGSRAIDLSTDAGRGGLFEGAIRARSVPG